MESTDRPSGTARNGEGQVGGPGVQVEGQAGQPLAATVSTVTEVVVSGPPTPVPDPVPAEPPPVVDSFAATMVGPDGASRAAGVRSARSLLSGLDIEGVTPPRVYIQTLAEAYVRSSATGRDEEAFSHLLAVFEKHNGGIINTYFCVNIPAAVVLTEIPPRRSTEETEYVLYLTYPFISDAPPWLVELLLELNSLHLEVRQFAPSRDKRLCMEIIFSAATQMLRYMETVGLKMAAGAMAANGARAASADHHQPAGLTQGEAANLRRIYEGEVQRARRFYQAVVMRKSQGHYFLGMILGVLFVAATALGAFWLNANYRGEGIADQALLIVSLVAGGIGAVVSVMQRMTNGSLSLLPNAEAGALMRVGAFRPLLGGLIAVVAFALLASGLLPVKTPDSGLGAAIYFFIAFAFFAGFSERFAQDTLAVGQSSLSGRTNDPPPPTAPTANS